MNQRQIYKGEIEMTLSEAKAYLQTVDPETVEFIEEYKDRIAFYPERIGWLIRIKQIVFSH